MTLDEDWTRIFRNLKGVDEYDDPMYEGKGYEGCRFQKLLKAYLASDDDIRADVHFRYARRTIKECDMAYYTNMVEVFDSANMDKPIMVRSDFSWYEPLPVENVIDVRELPDKKWYPARTWIDFIRCNGMRTSRKLSGKGSLMFTLKEAEKMDEPISDEIIELVRQNENYIEEFKSLGDSFSIPPMDEVLDDVKRGEFYFLITDPGVMTTSKLTEFVEKIDRFRKNCIFINEKCEIDPNDFDERLSIMLYSDDFDAVEVTVDDTGKVVCRFYENGKTPIKYADWVLKRKEESENRRNDAEARQKLAEELFKAQQSVSYNVEEIINDAKDRADNYERSYSMYYEPANSLGAEAVFTFCSPKLVELINGSTTAGDFEGSVSIEDTTVQIRSKAYDLFDALLLAYHNNSDLINSLIKMPDERRFSKKSFGLYSLEDFDKSIVWKETRQNVSDDDGNLLGEFIDYKGRVRYTYYNYFLNDIGTNSKENEKEIKTLWIGMKHDCGEDEICIDREVHKIGDVFGWDLCEIHISADCEQIAAEAMRMCSQLERVYIYSDNVQFPNDEVFREGVAIYAHKGSTSEAYANKFGYAFEMI